MPDQTLLDEAQTLFEAGKIEAAVVIYEKLTNLGSAEAALRLSWLYGSGQHDDALERITGVSKRRFFDDSPVGIVVLDSAGLIADANAAFRRMVGEEGSLAGGRRLLDFVGSEDGEKLSARLAAPDAGSTPLSIRLEAGQRVEAYIGAPWGSPGGHPGGAAGGSIVYLLSARERPSNNDELAQSKKLQAVGQLAGGIAHDFSNLLTTVIGYCDLLLLRHGDDEETSADIMLIKRSANRAANLVRQLLAFSRQQRIQPKILALTDVLRETSDLIRRLIGDGVELKIIHGRDLAPILVDQGQLELVIINIVLNARDGMPDGGTLTMRTDNARLGAPLRHRDQTLPPGEYVVLSITAGGVYMEPDQLDELFEPLIMSKGVGLGFGLSIVREIVEQMGGTIIASSKKDDGTTFEIFLPRYQESRAIKPAPDAVEAEAPEPEEAEPVATILLVEDEEAVRRFSVRALENAGYRVVSAEHGEAALEVLQQQPGGVDLLITDVVMPRMDGVELIKAVRRLYPGMKAIMISGYAEDVFRKNLDREMDATFVPKPFSLKDLLEAVEDKLGTDGKE
ncbi:MAG: response regulator [Proteobacteria bacterium]|nr:response regulator [Pseudomonadota bacterium]